MSQPYTKDQIYDAMRAAHAAGDAEAVKALAAALQSGASADEMNAMAADRGLQLNQDDLQANIASRDAGGQTNAVLPPERPQLTPFAATENAVAGGLEGAIGGAIDFPLDVARGVQGLITEGVGAVVPPALNALGMDGAAQVIQRGVEGQRNTLAGQPRGADAIQNLSPTPEGMEPQRFAAQLIGGFAVPFGPKAKIPTAAPKAPVKNPKHEIVRGGERHGVRVMNTDVNPPRGFIGKMVRAAGERIPFAGTGGQRVKQSEERVDAVKNLANEYGVTGATNFVDDVAADFVKTRGKLIEGLVNRKNRVLENTPGAFVGQKSVAVIDEQIARLERQNVGTKFNPLVKELKEFRKALTDGRSLEDVEVARKLLGEALESPNLANVKKVGSDAINKVYAPLRDDMGDFIKANAGEESFSKWKGANDRLAKMVGDLDDSAFKRALQGADVTPEKVTGLLFSKNPSEVKRLYRNLTASGKNKARSAVIYEALRRSGNIDEGRMAFADDISAKKFANSVDALARPIGVVFSEADRASVAGLARLLDATQQASVAAAAPPTGVQNTVPVFAALLTDAMGGFGAATATATVAGFAARVYESATVRNLLISLSKTKPGSKAEGAVMERVANAIASQTSIQRGNVGRAVNDNARGSLVAEDGVEEQ